MKRYLIEFTPKYYGQPVLDSQKYLDVLDEISEHIVAEIQTNAYGKYPPIHVDEAAYTDSPQKYVALMECQPRHIRRFVNGLKGTLGYVYKIHYHATEYVRNQYGKPRPKYVLDLDKANEFVVARLDFSR